MANTIQLRNSVVKNKAPLPSELIIGEVCVGAHEDSPMLIFKDNADNIIKIEPGSGVTPGPDAPDSPSAGDLWYDTDTELLYYWNGSAWVELGTAGDSPVTSVNTKVGAVVLTADDVGALESGDNISELTNDAGYLTSADLPDDSLWEEDGNAVTPKKDGADLTIEGNITAAGTVSALQLETGTALTGGGYGFYASEGGVTGGKYATAVVKQSSDAYNEYSAFSANKPSSTVFSVSWEGSILAAGKITAANFDIEALDPLPSTTDSGRSTPILDRLEALGVG